MLTRFETNLATLCLFELKEIAEENVVFVVVKNLMVTLAYKLLPRMSE
jgi:hypothetical protein